MVMTRITRISGAITLLITIFSLSLPAYAKYSGGTGWLNDPYQIATAEDLMLLGESPEDYHKHFILTADIDLDPNLPGRKVFDKAVIAPENDDTGIWYGSFLGVFNGNGYIISNLYIQGDSYLGLFGHLNSIARISNLGLEASDIRGTGDYIGGLAGDNRGSITTSYSSGIVIGNQLVGGLVGDISFYGGSIAMSYSTGAVSGYSRVGGLVGSNDGSIATSYSTGTVAGNEDVGGLVGYNDNGITFKSFWDMETSGQTTSAGGMGLTTIEMQDINTYLNTGWDFVDEILNGTCDYWQISPGDYPRLRYPVIFEGLGTAKEPYLIRDAWDLGTVWFKPLAYYRLEASVDMSGIKWFMSIIPWFHGSFDGNDCVISNLHIQGIGNLGLFGKLDSEAVVSNLGLETVDVNGTGGSIGGLVGTNTGHITNCYSIGTVSGGGGVGGLVGINGRDGDLIQCFSNVMVSSNGGYVGGLVGSNSGDVTMCYSTGMVTGDERIGGLVGENMSGSITMSYSTCKVRGIEFVGGLTGFNNYGDVTMCYSTGMVSGNSRVGGLVGDVHGLSRGILSSVVHSVWDVETSGLSGSAGGVGLSKAEMMDPQMLGLNGFANDPNWILDAGRNYPRLAWEGTHGEVIPESNIDWFEGSGSANDPYQIVTAEQLILLGKASILCDKHFVLAADIDLDPNLANGLVFNQSVIPSFMGVFDGNNHVISNLVIKGGSLLGLFGRLESGSEVNDLGIVDVNVVGSSNYIGGLAGYNYNSDVNKCYIIGMVRGNNYIGGLVGLNSNGDMNDCHSTGTVTGDYYIYVGGYVGGLLGTNYDGTVTKCYSNVTVIGNSNYVGGLVGDNDGTVTDCNSTGTVRGDNYVGGLLGTNYDGTVTQCYSTGTVNGNGYYVGGLVGENFHYGKITTSYSTASVSGDDNVGGLVGKNFYNGKITTSYSTGEVSGDWYVGGLVGSIYGSDVIQCYSTGEVSGDYHVGGLVGKKGGDLIQCYSTGKVNGNNSVGVGGLVGGGHPDNAIDCFWDVQTSGLTTSAGGIGKITDEMQTESTFLEAGWDFVDETANGTEDIWWIHEGQDYPRLWWELSISTDHPDYEEWVEVGEPVCWCYKRQCHGDTDGKPQGKQQYWVSTDDLDVLIAAWNKPFAEIDGRTVNGVPLICADFDHKAQGKENYRVSTDDLDILIANWNQANAPAADCP